MEDYDKAVSEAHLSAAGWGINDFNGSNPFECYVIYVRDWRTQHTQLFACRREDFLTQEVPFNAGALACAVADLMVKHAKGTLSHKEREVSQSVLAAYAKATQTYKKWRSLAAADDRLHIVLNIYANGTVRPFAPDFTGTVLPVEVLQGASLHVFEIDQAAHPEWFR